MVTDQSVYPQVGQAPKDYVESQQEVDVQRRDEQKIENSPKR